MCFAPAQLTELLHRQCCGGVGSGTDRKRNQDLIGVQAGIVITEIIHLQPLNRLDYDGRKQMHLIIDASQLLECIEHECCGRAQ